MTVSGWVWVCMCGSLCVCMCVCVCSSEWYVGVEAMLCYGGEGVFTLDGHPGHNSVVQLERCLLEYET